MEKAKKTPRQAATRRAEETQTQFEQTMYQRNLFLSMALNMTWQLALVVLIPVVGGYKLDEHFKTLPLFTIVGVLVAVAGVALVLWRVVKVANYRASNPKGSKK